MFRYLHIASKERLEQKRQFRFAGSILNEDVQMYLSTDLKSLICGASLSLLSLLVMAWVPRPVVLILFGSGVLLMTYGFVITLFIFIKNVIMDQEVLALEKQ
jgi:hypothetical protein